RDDRDVSAVAPDELHPGELTRGQLERGAIVLGTAKHDAAQGIIRHRMEFDGTDVAIHRGPAAPARLVVWIKQLIDAAVVGMQKAAMSVKDHGPRVCMRRRVVGTVADHALPRVLGQLCRIAAEDVRAEGGTAIHIGERGVLPVASNENYVWICGMRQDGTVSDALPAWEDLGRRHAQRSPGLSPIVGPEYSL